MQHGKLAASGACLAVHQSVVHSQTCADHVVDAVKPFGGETPSPARIARVTVTRIYFRAGNFPARILARCCPPGVNSSPQANSAPSRPPRAANSHSASVGKSLPAHLA